MQLAKKSNKSLISNKSLLFNQKESQIACLNNKQKDLSNINRKMNEIFVILERIPDIRLYARRKGRKVYE